MNKMPKWLENAVFYEIYPQSFKDSNSDGIGDIKGMSEKLDYIKDLGCNAIWINPLFESPFQDAGYDISNYYKVAPRYGTNDDLHMFFTEAHNKGIRVILDLVPGHTSTEHKWFKESQKAERNEFSDRYIWSGFNLGFPKGLKFINGVTERDGCCVTNYYSCQPALNYGFYKVEEPWQQPMDAEGPKATIEALKDIMRFWLDMGCDGFRVDMAGMLVKNDEDAKGSSAVWQKIRKFIDEEYPEAAIVSEWGEPDKSLQAGFHMDFLLHFGNSHYNDMYHSENCYFSPDKRGSAKAFVDSYKQNYKKTGGQGLICIPSGNHDIRRMSHFVDTIQSKLVFAFIMAMPGAPFVYYGDEIGMHYLKTKSVEGGYSRTGSRSPMQWNNTFNCGFSFADPDDLYIPVDPDKENRPNVAAQENDENSLLNEVKRLIKLRLQHKALQSTAALEFITDDYPLILRRSCEDEEIIIIINCAKESYAADIDGEILYTVGEDCELQSGKVIVKPCSAVFVKIS